MANSDAGVIPNGSRPLVADGTIQFAKKVAPSTVFLSGEFHTVNGNPVTNRMALVNVDTGQVKTINTTTQYFWISDVQPLPNGRFLLLSYDEAIVVGPDGIVSPSFSYHAPQDFDGTTRPIHTAALIADGQKVIIMSRYELVVLNIADGSRDQATKDRLLNALDADHLSVPSEFMNLPGNELLIYGPMLNNDGSPAALKYAVLKEDFTLKYKFTEDATGAINAYANAICSYADNFYLANLHYFDDGSFLCVANFEHETQKRIVYFKNGKATRLPGWYGIGTRLLSHSGNEVWISDGSGRFGYRIVALSKNNTVFTPTKQVRWLNGPANYVVDTTQGELVLGSFSSIGNKKTSGLFIFPDGSVAKVGDQPSDSQQAFQALKNAQFRSSSCSGTIQINHNQSDSSSIGTLASPVVNVISSPSGVFSLSASTSGNFIDAVGRPYTRSIDLKSCQFAFGPMGPSCLDAPTNVSGTSTEGNKLSYRNSIQSSFIMHSLDNPTKVDVKMQGSGDHWVQTEFTCTNLQRIPINSDAKNIMFPDPRTNFTTVADFQGTWVSADNSFELAIKLGAPNDGVTLSYRNGTNHDSFDSKPVNLSDDYVEIPPYKLFKAESDVLMAWVPDQYSFLRLTRKQQQ